MNVVNSGAGGKTAGHTASIGASAAVFDASGRVLLVKRGKPPLSGLWSLPGGHIEPGEASAETARREVAEETGLAAEIAGFLTTFDVPLRDAAGHRIAVMPLDVYFGRASDGSAPVAAGDAADARFVEVDALSGYELTEKCEELVRAAWARLAGPLERGDALSRTPRTICCWPASRGSEADAQLRNLCYTTPLSLGHQGHSTHAAHDTDRNRTDNNGTDNGGRPGDRVGQPFRARRQRAR